MKKWDQISMKDLQKHNKLKGDISCRIVAHQSAFGHICIDTFDIFYLKIISVMDCVGNVCLKTREAAEEGKKTVI